MKHLVSKHWAFYLQVMGLLLLLSAACFALSGSYSFSIIQQQQFSPTLHFILVNFSFFGDCIFVFVLSAWLVLSQKSNVGTQLFFACLLAFVIEQIIENTVSTEHITLHFEALQQIYQPGGPAIKNTVSLNTTMMITCAALFTKYSRSMLVNMFLMIAVVLMAFSRIYLVQENFGSIILALPVSFVAFLITEVWIKYKNPLGVLNNAGRYKQHRAGAYHFH